METCEVEVLRVEQHLTQCLMTEVKANKGALVALINASEGNPLVRAA